MKSSSLWLILSGVTVALLVTLFLLTTGANKSPDPIFVTVPVGVTPPISNVLPSAAVPPPSPIPVVPDSVPLQSNVVKIPEKAALTELSGGDITSSTPDGDGYLVLTSFGAKWHIPKEQVEQLPHSLQIRIDYNKYGTGATEREAP